MSHLVNFVSVLPDRSSCSVDRLGVCWVIMLRRWYSHLQDVVPTQLLLAICCGLLLVGLALTNSAQSNGVHTIHFAAEHSTARQSETNPSKSSHSASHQPNCHDLKSPSDQHAANSHDMNMAGMCCAWICSAHAVLPNMLTAVFQPVERLLADPFNFAGIQNPQLAHVRPIERPPRLFS